MFIDALVATAICALGTAIWLALSSRWRNKIGTGATAVFVIALILRLALAVIYSAGAEYEMGLTKDGFGYDRDGWSIAKSWQGLAPPVDRPLRDHAYYNVVAAVYYVFGHIPLAAKAINCLAGALVAITVLSIAYSVYGNRRLALVAGAITACMPSFVHWSSLLIKDALATLAVLAIVHGTMRIRHYGLNVPGILQVGVGLLTVVGLRAYLVPILSICVVIALMTFPLRSRKSVHFANGALAATAVLLLAFTVGGGWFGMEILEEEELTNIERIAHLRNKLGRGQGGFGSGDNFSTIPEQIASVGRGIGYFFVGINVLNPTSGRQLAALPEAIAALALLPFVLVGIWRTLRYRMRQAIPALGVGIAVMLAYSTVTTNAGPLYRWRMQVLPIFIMFGVAGVMRSWIKSSEENTS